MKAIVKLVNHTTGVTMYFGPFASMEAAQADIERVEKMRRTSDHITMEALELHQTAYSE